MSGPQCCENPPTLSPSSGGGHVHDIGGFSCYVSTGPTDSTSAVLLISDVYGYEAPKLRYLWDNLMSQYLKLADKVAAAGFYVVVPDFLKGDPFTPGGPLKDWLKDHGPVEAVEFAKPVIEALKSKGIFKVGAAGFCWGAKVTVELAKSADIEAAVLLHPSLVTVDDIKGVKVPIAVLGAEVDQLSPPELVKQFEAALEANPEVDHFVKIFLGVAHGWTVRYKDDDEAIIKSANEAHQDLLNWFTKYIKV